MLEAIGVVSISSVGRSSARFHIGTTVGFWTKRSKEGRRIKSPRTHLQIVAKLNVTAMGSPVLGKFMDNFLETKHQIRIHPIF
jgi:hypothetical protein